MPLNSLSVELSFCVIMCILSMSAVSSLIFNVLASPFFAVDGYIVLVSKFMSLTFRFMSSIGLSPVSIDILSLTASFFEDFAISMFIFSVVGMFGIFSDCL